MTTTSRIGSLPPRTLLERWFPSRRNPLLLFPQAAARHGGLVRLAPGGRAYLVSHPEHVKHVLLDNHLNYRHNVRQQVSMGRESLALAEGEEWKQKRRLMQPLFHHQRLRVHAQTMAQGLAPMLDRWSRAAEQRQTVDVADEMVHLTLDLLVLVLFGKDDQRGGDRLEATVRTVFEYFNDRASGRLSKVPFIARKRQARFQRSLDKMKSAITEVIASRRGTSEEDGSLLTAFLVSEDPQGGVRQTDAQVLDEVMMLLVMGHMTTAMALTWCFYLLGRNPEWEERVLEEVSATAGGGPPSFEAIADLDVTRRVVEESLRLYPPSWRFTRQAVAWDELDGHPITAGTQLVLCPWVTHRRADLWPEPDRFDPDRFLEAPSAARHRFTFFPFGGGPRACVAREMAMVEIPLILSAILQKVRLQPAGSQPAEPLPRITLEPKGGLPMKLSAR